MWLLVFVQFAPHLGAVFLFSCSFHSVPKRIDIIEAEPPYDSTPGVNLGKRVVEFGSNAAQFGEFCPGNVWEIMVFIVVTNVPSKLVEGPIVQVGLRGEKFRGNIGVFGIDFLPRLVILVEHIVLRNKVAGTRVQQARQKRAHDKVAQCSDPHKLDHQHIRQHLAKNVEQMNVGELDLGDEHGTESIEKDLAAGKKDLSQHIGEKYTLPACGEIGIEVGIA